MMDVVNETRGFTLSVGAELRDSPWGRFRGLMLSERKDVVLAARRENIVDSMIHMMFMLYPIKVLWVNEDMMVVDVKEDVKPFNLLKPGTWRMHKPREPAKYVVELGVGDVKNTEIGDRIKFK